MGSDHSLPADDAPLADYAAALFAIEGISDEADHFVGSGHGLPETSAASLDDYAWPCLGTSDDADHPVGSDHGLPALATIL